MGTHYIRQCREGTLCYGPVTQREFLHELSIGVRAEMLMKAYEQENERADIRSAYEMLTEESKMGSRFKFLAVFPATMKPIHQKFPPVGFATSLTSHEAKLCT